MGDRRGVAATLTAVIVFTALLFANAALYSAGSTYLSASELSAVQAREFDLAPLLVGLVSVSSLSTAQSYLESHPMDCSSSIESYLSPLTQSSSSAGADHGIEYSMVDSWGYSESDQSGGDRYVSISSTLGSFDGFSSGELNLFVSASLNETEDGGLPLYQVNDTVTVHLPVEVEDEVGLCRSALSALGTALESLKECNSTGVEAVISYLRAEEEGLQGISMGASAQRELTLAGLGGCEVDYWVSLTEPGIEGVSGSFDWSLQGSGSLWS